MNPPNYIRKTLDEEDNLFIQTMMFCQTCESKSRSAQNELQSFYSKEGINQLV